jgi:hypothetical protein
MAGDKYVYTHKCFLGNCVVRMGGGWNWLSVVCNGLCWYKRFCSCRFFGVHSFGANYYVFAILSSTEIYVSWRWHGLYIRNEFGFEATLFSNYVLNTTDLALQDSATILNAYYTRGFCLVLC